MTRDELFDYIQKIDDPAKDYTKIISTLHYTHYFLMDKYKKVLAVYDLTPIQSNILGIIVFNYPKSASLEQIKEMVLEPGSDVSRTVVRLAEKGFIKKITDPTNSRKLSIIATKKGIKIHDEIAANSAFNKKTVPYTDKEARAFIGFLKILREQFI